MASRAPSLARAGETAWSRMPKANAELFALTYGALVTQLIADYEDLAEVNQQLDRMGYNIGVRLIDEFLAKAPPAQNHCTDFRETADVMAKVAFKMFLGVTADVANWNAEGTACSMLLVDNPLAEFVELPPSASGLWYSNLLCGVIRGALEMLQMRVECSLVRETVRGDEVNEIRVELKEVMEDVAGDEYKE